MLFKWKKIQLKTFDLLVIFASIVLAVTLFFILFRKQSDIKVVVKVDQDSMYNQIGSTPNWFAQYLRVGMKESDVFGRPTAQIIGIRNYYSADQRTIVYLTVSLKAVYSISNHQYTYKGKNILVGSTIQIPFDEVLINGAIIDMEGENKVKPKKMMVEAKIVNLDPTFPQTEGVPPYVADSINAGDIMSDSLGQPAIKINKKIIEDAKMVVTTSNGDVLLQRNPLRKDVYLELEMWTEKIGDRYYLFGDSNFPVIINESSVLPQSTGFAGLLPFYTDKSIVWLTITKINAIQ